MALESKCIYVGAVSTEFVFFCSFPRKRRRKELGAQDGWHGKVCLG